MPFELAGERTSGVVEVDDEGLEFESVEPRDEREEEDEEKVFHLRSDDSAISASGI